MRPVYRKNFLFVRLATPRPTGISFEEYLEVYVKAFGERMKEVVKKL